MLNSRFMYMTNVIYPPLRTCTTIINEDKKVSISIMNSQSIKNKEDQILHHFMDRKANQCSNHRRPGSEIMTQIRSGWKHVN